MRSLSLAALALLVMAGTTGCTKIENALAKVPFLAFMASSPALDPYEMTRPAPVGSVPVRDPFGVAPHAVGNSQTALLDLASRASSPLLAGDTSDHEAGRAYFERYCTVCHGPLGAGDGTILGPGRFPFAPSLVTPTMAGYTDSYVYAVVRQGRGLMPAYGPRMTETQRWQVVSYVRSLARSGGSTTTAATAAPTGAAAAPAQGATATTER